MALKIPNRESSLHNFPSWVIRRWPWVLSQLGVSLRSWRLFGSSRELAPKPRELPYTHSLQGISRNSSSPALYPTKPPPTQASPESTPRLWLRFSCRHNHNCIFSFFSCVSVLVVAECARCVGSATVRWPHPRKRVCCQVWRWRRKAELQCKWYACILCLAKLKRPKHNIYREYLTWTYSSDCVAAKISLVWRLRFSENVLL